MAPKPAADGSPSSRDPSAAQLLTTILGDYWFASTDHIPSAALVAVLDEFGIGADATRAALSRLCRHGRLERRRHGRHTSYRLAPAVRSSAARMARRLACYGTEPVPWDGRWLCVAFSIPESDRQRRAALRHRLRGLRMASVVDGVWISPRDVVDEVNEVLEEVGVVGAALLRATEVPTPKGTSLVDAWDLDARREELEGFGELVDAIAARLAGDSLEPGEALIVRTDVMARWRALAATDPWLPDELLPPTWPLRAVRDRFVAVYDALGPLAEQRVRQLAGVDLDDPSGPRHHRLADIAG